MIKCVLAQHHQGGEIRWLFILNTECVNILFNNDQETLMHIHNVFFWLRNDVNQQSSLSFEAGLKSLTNDPGVTSGYYGTPAGIDREVVDNSYSYGLVLVFPNKSAHDQYQEGTVHKKFLDEHAAKWDKVLVYDVRT